MASSRRQYPFHLIEPKWQQTWEEQQAFRAFNPGEEIPAAHPFAQRHKLSGKVSAPQLPPKFYILDMFPYPSGAGLHVGHPEGYTATDILARYRRACGFNVLHPMGWDSFGLPAEQYAVKTGQHPRVTTEANIANFTRQIKSLGFSYDWSRELATTDPDYFKWTQWIFLKLYNSWLNPETNTAEPIETLKYPAGLRLPFLTSDKTELETLESNRRIFRDSKRLAYVSEAPVNWCPELGTVLANEEVIDGKSEVGGFPVIRKPMRQWMLRITAYAEKLLADLATIDWSDSLKEMQRNWIGKSEGAYVCFRLEGRPKPVTEVPNNISEPDSEMINFSEIDAFIQSASKRKADSIWVFTTRPDTLFGATYMVLAPEHPCVDEITTDEHRAAIESYKAEVARKSDLQRTELAKEKTGVFTGAYAINPLNSENIPIWIADYVLASYGTGAIMAVPAHDTRDFEFARKFSLPIKPVVLPPDEWLKTNVSIPDIVGVSLEELRNVELDNPDEMKVLAENFAVATNLENADYCEECVRLFQKITCTGDATPDELQNLRFCYQEAPACFKQGDKPAIFVDEGILVNSGPFNGMIAAIARVEIVNFLEREKFGKRTINYKLRDWLFSRQRYWGEPFPIIWKKDVAVPQGGMYHEALPESSLPLLPPSLEDYKPTSDGQPPLARAKDWLHLPDGSIRETNTMPQWAGSCWYYLRYLDAKNAAAFVGHEAESYWMGARVTSLNRSTVTSETDSTIQRSNDSTTPGVDLYVGGTEHAVLHLLYARFWHKVLFDLGYVSTPEPFFKLVNQGLILGEDGQKMSKSRGNVVNPDDVLTEYGADAFRLYEMFMGPLEMVKPWNTKGVEGVYRFLGRVWRLFVDEKSETAFEQAETTTEPQNHRELLDLIMLDGAVADVAATPAQLKTLHACIKKVTEDLDGMRFNTAISAMMVFVNEAMTWQTKPLSVLKPFLQLLAPFAPHMAEELWARLHSTFGQRAPSLPYEPWPKFDPAHLIENEIEIPVQVNGKLRDVIRVSINATQSELEVLARDAEKVKPFIADKTIKKIIVVPKRMVNIIVG